MGNNSVTIFPESLKATAFGNEITGKSPTELYANIMTTILRAYPDIIGLKETHFTTDSDRAEQYTGTTRSVVIGGLTVYIKTGLSTKDKWNGIKKTCELAGVSFELADGEIGVSVPSVQPSRSADVVPEKKPVVESVPVYADEEESKFAIHTEYCYYYDNALEYNESIENKNDGDTRLLSHYPIFFNGSLYFNNFSDYVNTDIIYKSDRDGNIKAIRLNNINTNNENFRFAVNKHGIFVLTDNIIKLFDENGNLKNKIKISTPRIIYIYDNLVYVWDSYRKIHIYNVLTGSDNIVWKFTEQQKYIENAINDYHAKNVAEYKEKKMKFTFNVNFMYANADNIIIGFRCKSSSSIIYDICLNINLSRGYSEILQINCLEKEDSVKIFTFDMRNNLIFWIKQSENNDKYIFSTDIKPVDDIVRKNSNYIYKVPAAINFSSDKNNAFYFDGKNLYGASNCCIDGLSMGDTEFIQYISPKGEIHYVEGLNRIFKLAGFSISDERIYCCIGHDYSDTEIYMTLFPVDLRKFKEMQHWEVSQFPKKYLILKEDMKKALEELNKK